MTIVLGVDGTSYQSGRSVSVVTIRSKTQMGTVKNAVMPSAHD